MTFNEQLCGRQVAISFEGRSWPEGRHRRVNESTQKTALSMLLFCFYSADNKAVGASACRSARPAKVIHQKNPHRTLFNKNFLVYLYTIHLFFSRLELSICTQSMSNCVLWGCFSWIGVWDLINSNVMTVLQTMFFIFACGFRSCCIS